MGALKRSEQLKKVNFREEFPAFEQLSHGSRRFSVSWADRHPCLDDKTRATSFDRHYIYHTAWAARVLAKLKPQVHVDISSSLYFCSLASAFTPVKFYDYRPPNLHLDNLTTEAADLLSLPFLDQSVQSISCMHVVEHVGLGRYGDPLDANGDLKAMRELQRVLAPGGMLLFVVPIGRPRIMFNAHRIYSYAQVMSYFPGLELRQFALIPDSPLAGGLIYDASPEICDQQDYGCGCFWFVAPPILPGESTPDRD